MNVSYSGRFVLRVSGVISTPLIVTSILSVVSCKFVDRILLGD
jgi:hypothetical protein